MEHKLIKTDNYLLVVDDSEIKVDDYYYDNDALKVFKHGLLNHLFDCKKIISHLPLNGSAILDGVDLLPPIEDDVKKLAEIHWGNVHRSGVLGFIEGYNKAREKYKYTEEDVRKAITMARDLEDWQDLVWEYEYDDIIQSLHQYPTEFECEMETVPHPPPSRGFSVVPKTITTAQGIQWVGKYK